MRAKAENVPEESPMAVSLGKVEVIDGLKYQPKKVASLTWRECIKKIWKTDRLICPGCLHEMRIISFITETSSIKSNFLSSHLINNSCLSGNALTSTQRVISTEGWKSSMFFRGEKSNISAVKGVRISRPENRTRNDGMYARSARTILKNSIPPMDETGLTERLWNSPMIFIEAKWH